MNTTSCCFCGQAIQDRLQVEIAVPLEDGAVQGLWGHCACLAARLHQDVPTLLEASEGASLTPDQAFQAMFAFLEMQYETTHAPELGALLGSMALLQDGGSADPAVQADWDSAVEQAREGRVGSGFELSARRGANEA